MRKFILLSMTVIATYNNLNEADMALTELKHSHNVPESQISVATLKESYNKFSNENRDMAAKNAQETTGATLSGAGAGAAIGFLIGALGLATGFGGLLIGGPLAAALGGSAMAANTALGATVGALGGFVSGLTKAGVNEADAQSMSGIVEKGGAMIAVNTDGLNEDEIKHVLNSHSPAKMVHV